MATIPLSGTNIRLLSNIPFHADYKHSRWFDNQTQQTNYFLNKTVVHSMTDATFQRIEGRHYVRVNESIDDLWSTNYLMFKNEQYSNKWFYAFVTNLEYKQKKTTFVHFEIDVLQTWMFDMNFQPSYVAREHRPLWNNDGTPVINTISEGLDYGTDYETVYTNYYEPNNGYRWLVIILKEQTEANAVKEVNPVNIGSPQPLSYYVIPFNQFGEPAYMKKGTSYIRASSPRLLMENLFSHTDMANNIVSMYVTEHIGAQVAYTNDATYGDTFVFPTTVGIEEVDITKDEDGTLIDSYAGKILDFPQFSGTTVTIESDKYNGFESVDESKLLMYPYCVTILDDFKGNRLELKNEYINNTSLDVIIKGSLGVSNYVTYNVKNYNYSDTGISDGDKYSNETALINKTPQDLPILTDMLSAFLQGNKNSIENQRSQLKWGMGQTITNSAIQGVASIFTRNVAGGAQAISSGIFGTKQKQLELQAINAKQQDIDNQPPQMSSRGSNTAYNFGHDYNGVMVIKKQIKPEYRRKLQDYFKKFGYKTSEIKVPNFHTRENWNYVQTEDCIILGDIINDHLNELKSVFDNGITLWHTDNIGNYSLSNGVM